LKAGVWFRRGRLFMVSPVHGDYRRCQAETPLSDLFKFAEPALYQRVLGMERKDLDPGNGKQNRISLLFGNQKVNLRPVSADREEWVTADNEEAGSEDLCFLTDTTPKEVIDHLKNCGVAIEEGPVNKQGAVGSLKSVYCRDPDGSLIEISAYED
jgi:catechol 2,3-dioxygenase-like lactoylglutathione lyase family enzyme